MARETVELLMRQGRQRGAVCTTNVDWRQDHKRMRQLLVEAVKRDGYPEHRIGEYCLEVARPQGGRVLRTFTAVHRG
jgi:hypothetical protein